MDRSYIDDMSSSSRI